MNSIQKMLLERAEKDYPKGTVAKSALVGTQFTSAGAIIINENNSVYCTGEDRGAYLVYGSINDKWAEVVSSEKPIAIKVNNEREYDLLMEHFESKDWVQSKKYAHHGFGAAHHIFEYKDYYQRIDESNFIATNQYNVIHLSDIGIKVPVFVMTSEDGVPLYEGDNSYTALRVDGVWELDRHYGEGEDFNRFDVANNGMFSNTETERQFSTREAADLWIAEQNKPKDIRVEMDHDTHANVFTNGVEFFFEGHYGLSINGIFLKEIFTAWQSLQQQSDKN